MNNDLISRSALKKAVEKYRPKSKVKSLFLDGEHCMFMNCISEIDNAPTVEVGYLTNCANCEKVEKIRAKRPQGEWARTGSMTKRSYQRMCNKCHKISYFCGKGNYPNCPYCLAEMKGGEKND